MSFLKLLDKLFDVTDHVENTAKRVTKTTEKALKRIVANILNQLFTAVLLGISLILVLVGLILWLSRFAPLEYVFLFFGLIGILFLLMRRIRFV